MNCDLYYFSIGGLVTWIIMVIWTEIENGINDENS